MASWSRESWSGGNWFSENWSHDTESVRTQWLGSDGKLWGGTVKCELVQETRRDGSIGAFKVGQGGKSKITIALYTHTWCFPTLSISCASSAGSQWPAWDCSWYWKESWVVCSLKSQNIIWVRRIPQNRGDKYILYHHPSPRILL